MNVVSALVCFDLPHGTQSSLGTRKLKCSGELPQCERCQQESIQCVYSAQKRMGRPRKRRRDDTDQPVQQSSRSVDIACSLASFPGPGSISDIGPISPANSDGHGSLYGIPSDEGMALPFLDQDQLDLNDLQAQESVQPQGSVLNKHH